MAGNQDGITTIEMRGVKYDLRAVIEASEDLIGALARKFAGGSPVVIRTNEPDGQLFSWEPAGRAFFRAHWLLLQHHFDVVADRLIAHIGDLRVVFMLLGAEDAVYDARLVACRTPSGRSLETLDTVPTACVLADGGDDIRYLTRRETELAAAALDDVTKRRGLYQHPVRVSDDGGGQYAVPISFLLPLFAQGVGRLRVCCRMDVSGASGKPSGEG